jgi:hypothetical protein
MEDRDYLLTIRFPLKAMDDPAAREQAKRIVDGLELTADERRSVKLQRVKKEGAPEGIDF